MSQPIHVQIIKEARTLIADEKNWCRRQMAYDRDGVTLCATDSKAAKFCAYGGLIAAAHHMTKDCGRAYDLASHTVSYFGGSSALIEVNDLEGHAAVLALFDEAITGHR
jgi:hypothetical protein